MVYIFIKDNCKSNLHIINLYGSIYSFKTDLSKKIGQNIDNISLQYHGKILEDNKTFKSYNIKEKETVDLSLKNNGGTVAKGLLIFLSILIIFSFVGSMLSGLLPITAHMVSAAIITAVSSLGNFILGFISDKWPIKNFFVKWGYKLFNIAKFFLSNLSILVFVIIITALSAYIPYYLKFGNNVCKAINTSFMLGAVIGIYYATIYLIYNIPFIILNLFGNSDGPISRIIIKGMKKLAILSRKIGLLFAWPLTGIYMSVLNILETGLDKAAEAEDFIQQFILNFNELRTQFNTPPYAQQIQPIKPVLDMFNYTYIENPEDQKKYIEAHREDFPRSKIAWSYIIRFGVDNIFGLIMLLFSSLKTICPSSTEADYDLKIEQKEKVIEDLKKKLKKNMSKKTTNNLDKALNKNNLIEQLQKNIEKIRNKKKRMLISKELKELKRSKHTDERIKAVENQLKNVQKNKEDALNAEVINTTCIMNYITNGMLSGAPFTCLLWFILFLILLFKPDLFKNFGK